MKLLIIRHGIAEDRDAFAATGKSDDLRPLTAEGRTKMAHSADGLREVAPDISLLAASPLVRAQETAEIVGRVFETKIGSTTDSLLPDASLDAFLDWVREYRAQPVVAVVGHEPHLSTLATWLISGITESRIELKKGGACLLTFDGATSAGSATLEWLMHPGHLRALRRR